MKNFFQKIGFFVFKNPKKAFIIFTAPIFYIILHEYVHYFTALALGASGVLNWNIFQPNLYIENIVGMSYSSIFLITVMPYFFGIFLLLILNILKNMGAKSEILPLISMVILLDFIVNFIMAVPVLIINSSNDFLNMLRIGSLNGNVYIVAIFNILLLIYAVFLFLPFKEELIKSYKQAIHNE